MRILIAAFVSFLFQSLYLSKHGRFDDVESLALFLIYVYLVIEAIFYLLSQSKEDELDTPGDSTAPVTSETASKKTASTSSDIIVQAHILNFLAQLQHKGRLVDFVMDDVSGVSDAQIGAAARAVHQGYREQIMSYMNIVPLRSEAEGSTVTINAGFNPAEVRLLGVSAKEAPFSGALLHRGWAAKNFKLPRLIEAEHSHEVLAPAEIDVK